MLRRVWGGYCGAINLENDDNDDDDDKIVDGDKDQKVHKESLENEYLRQLSGDMVILGDLCRKWQNGVLDATLEKILEDGRRSRRRLGGL